MRIAIDGTTMDGFGGIEHYTRSIVSALRKLEPRTFVVKPRFGIPFVSRHVLLPLEARAMGASVLLCPSGQIPLGWTGKSVIVVHDLAIYEHPEWFEGVKKNIATDWLVPRSLKRADRIIVPSHATADQLARLFPETKDKISIVAHGVDVPADGETAGPRDDGEAVLFIGTLEPRKNLVNAVRAFDAFLQSHPDRATTARFVVAGKVGWAAQPILDEIESVNARWHARAGRPVVKRMDSVTEQEKWSLLRQASCLVFVSWWEGFGLPVLEAMAAGVPVITSGRGAFPEVGGDAAMYVEPDDVEQMAFAIAQCVLMPEAMRELREAGKKRAAQFTWARTARETLNVLESFCG